MKTEFKCPSGHDVQAAYLHSTVKLDEPDIDQAIIFFCPGGKRGHTFTLKKAAAAGTFTEEEVAKIRAGGKHHQAKYKEVNNGEI